MTDNFRAMLKEHLALRKARNAGYSLRAFARDLSISPSRLSEVISGRHSLSIASAHRVAQRLQLPEEERQLFVDLVQAESRRDLAGAKSALSRIRKRQRERAASGLTEGQLTALTSWKHLAILEAAAAGPVSPAELAARFNLVEAECAGIIRNLSDLRLITRKRSGQWSRTRRDIFVGGAIPSASIRRMLSRSQNQVRDA